MICNNGTLGVFKQIFTCRTRLFGSLVPVSNAFALPKPSNHCKRIVSFNHSCERNFKSCRQCSFLLVVHSHIVRLHSLSTNHQIQAKLSSHLRLCPKTNIQELQKRYKTKKPEKRPEYDSDTDEEDEDDNYEGQSKATKPVTLRTQSMRLDGLMKKALGVARNKIETAFYEGKVRVNGTKPVKKSYQVKVGDEVDLIKGVSPMNPDFLSISRVEVLSVTEDDDDVEQLIVKIRRTKTMYIENYGTSPWKTSSPAE